MTDVKDLMNLIGWVYIVLAVIGIGLALMLPKTRTGKTLSVLAVIVAFAIVPGQGAWEAKQARDTYRKRQAYFEEKCRTVAGEKIYRKVENVEGLLLMKVRPARGEVELRDRMWPGAAFGLEATADGYITSFLGYEHSSNPVAVSPSNRGYINTDRRPGDLPGYRWVETIDEKDGIRYRYTGRYDEPWKTDSSYSTSYVRFNLDKTPATGPSPRYGVTFEDHVIPEERAMWISSSTVKVIDLETKDVLGELTRYAMSRGGVSPWLAAYKCPGHTVGASEATRKFVDQVLIPAKEK